MIGLNSSHATYDNISRTRDINQTAAANNKVTKIIIIIIPIRFHMAPSLLVLTGTTWPN